jgi:hypothetical protein
MGMVRSGATPLKIMNLPNKGRLPADSLFGAKMAGTMTEEQFYKIAMESLLVEFAKIAHDNGRESYLLKLSEAQLDAIEEALSKESGVRIDNLKAMISGAKNKLFGPNKFVEEMKALGSNNAMTMSASKGSLTGAGAHKPNAATAVMGDPSLHAPKAAPKPAAPAPRSNAEILKPTPAVPRVAPRPYDPSKNQPLPAPSAQPVQRRVNAPGYDPTRLPPPSTERVQRRAGAPGGAGFNFATA